MFDKLGFGGLRTIRNQRLRSYYLLLQSLNGEADGYISYDENSKN